MIEKPFVSVLNACALLAAYFVFLSRIFCFKHHHRIRQKRAVIEER
jgi:hypothetical protein